ncbi:N-acetylmuramate alpha-1-phosphate uridylyltransferase MurU [Candidatus Sulfurimonas baltica]|uniref:Nucleotidyltransferase family protein n=1 Tax=Candidatus Sulfurimonas baltica TaxID=2740404 RepID=A0A7S7LVI3_9BACT|nr:nucleotidyltransferase family protein [Candidatus Sulfurimonas baltica]QOY52090.1 nucleotidyltransferase family protein [Candidatus Sulfurimonas baltica]
MKAMILAAGRGERMRPLTDHIPKPLLEIHGKALIVWHIEKLASLGFSEIIINIAHLGFKIPMALGDGSKWGVKLIYSNEQKEGALESAGGIIKALPLLGEGTFLVVNGDIWCDYEFDFNFDLEDDLAHLILVPNPKHNPDGDFVLKNRRVFNEGEERLTFSGIGYYSPELFKGLKSEKKALAPILREAMIQKRVGGSIHKSRWYDIGTPQRLNSINNEV